MSVKSKITQLEKLVSPDADSCNTPDTEPVDPLTFIESPDYMDCKEDVYPVILEDFIDIVSGMYVEVVLTGGIGSGKTFLALLLMAHELYRLSCLEDPQGALSQSSSAEIEIVFQSVTADLAESVDFRHFKELIDRAPYFQNRCKRRV
jgi:hypothetical protein